MFYSITNQSGHTAYDLKEFVCDTEMDLQYIPIECKPGSTTLVIESSNVYMLNNKREWINLSNGTMSNFSLPQWKGGNY